MVGVAASAAWPDTGQASAGTAAPADTGGTAAAPTTGAKIDFAAKPGADWVARDPVLPPASTETVHNIVMTAYDQDVAEVAPGVEQQIWTYDKLMPGPFYRGKVGDQFNFTLKNEGTMGHSVDFHASKVAWNVRMATINPGESIEYPFEAKHAGIYMYHCGTPPALHHIGAGMYGAIIVDPPDLAPVDHEFAFVQSEIYTGPQGEVGDLTKMQKSAWDAIVFNGYVNGYRDRPIRVEPGQRIRAWVLDAGPSENSSWHVIGTIFDTVFKEGNYLLRPGDGQRGGSQALDLQPAQGGFVELVFPEAGHYPFVSHVMVDAERGARGIVGVTP
jgi:nitrite reductase (NO-forming)